MKRFLHILIYILQFIPSTLYFLIGLVPQITGLAGLFFIKPGSDYENIGSAILMLIGCFALPGTLIASLCLFFSLVFVLMGFFRRNYIRKNIKISHMFGYAQTGCLAFITFPAAILTIFWGIASSIVISACLDTSVSANLLWSIPFIIIMLLHLAGIVIYPALAIVYGIIVHKTKAEQA